MKRTGKIARLPYHIRQELNRRLLDNEPGDPLLDWLNARPEVQTMLSEQFDGHPITKQNLSEWRTGGFAVWELRQEIFDDALEAEEASDELDAVSNSGLADKLMTLLAGRYASFLVHWDGEVTPEVTQKLRVLHILCRDLITLRRWAKGKEGKEEGRLKNEELGKRPGTSGPSESVARSQANFRPEARGAGGGAMTDMATSCRHPEPETGKVEGRMRNDELGKSAGTSGQSHPVAPGRTTSPADLVAEALAELAASGRHPERAGKPLPGMPNSVLSKALKAARESQRPPGQPALAVLPDWDEVARVAPGAVSGGQK